MTKAEILAEIRRTAVRNGGAPLGMKSFERETGIRHADWFGIHWRSWGDAVKEAGFEPNVLTTRFDEGYILRRYCELTRETGHFPTKGDLRLKRRSDTTFPSDAVFTRRFGSFPAARARAYDYCLANSEFADVAPLLTPTRRERLNTGGVVASSPSRGFVYLIKHGSRSEYKIGKTFNPLRREGEIRLQLPEKVAPVHYIETDDPAGIEAYWHARFASKRKAGEWFDLNRDEVAAFRRWKKIV